MPSQKDQLTPAPWNQPPSPTPPPATSEATPAQAPTPDTQSNSQRDQQMRSLHQQNAALSQILWNLVRQYEPTEEQVVVSSIASDPLWQLAFMPADAENSDPTKVRVLAGFVPPITEQEKKRVVRFLRGTDKPMMDALEALQLSHPPAYVEQQIAGHLKWYPGTKETEGNDACWQSVTPASLAERAKNVLQIPKA